MQVLILKEAEPETRVPMTPQDVGVLVKLGATVEVEAGIGASLGVADEAYKEAGATILEDATAGRAAADLILRLSVPSVEDAGKLKPGAIHISHMDPFNNNELVEAFAASKASAISLEMIPRTTIAQKMDVLSSQANLAGYVAVLLGAERLDKILPMMMTPAGTIRPARVFVIGAGVAGLQAIATAKRLGARVDAFDVRPEAQDQILSLGAKPLKIDLGETGRTKDGYAKKLTDEQIDIQRKAMAKQCAGSDIVITTAKVFGRKAPLIVTAEMLDEMQPGSVVIDLAVETGGNVEGVELNKEIDRKGVLIVGLPELARHVPVAASQMFSANLKNFIEHFWDKEAGKLVLKREDEIIQGALVTHDGEVVNERLKAIAE